MASSIRKAQTPLECKLCDSSVGLPWKCKDCNLLMCEKCKTSIHPRFKSADNHSVISIKDVSKMRNEHKDDDISEMFASLQDTQTTEVSTKVISYVYNTYTTDLPSVHGITCFDGDKVYYYNNIKDKLVKAKLLKNSIKIKKLSRHKNIRCGYER